jgi:hypothetical protein
MCLTLRHFDPKRGRKQETTFPKKEVMDILKISHRQAQAYHQAGLLMETVDMLFDEKVEWLKNRIAVSKVRT